MGVIANITFNIINAGRNVFNYLTRTDIFPHHCSKLSRKNWQWHCSGEDNLLLSNCAWWQYFYFLWISLVCFSFHSFMPSFSRVQLFLCSRNPDSLPLNGISPHFFHERGMSTVCPLLVLLVEQVQGLQRVCAGVLKVLTALQQEITNQALILSSELKH